MRQKGVCSSLLIKTPTPSPPPCMGHGACVRIMLLGCYPMRVILSENTCGHVRKVSIEEGIPHDFFMISSQNSGDNESITFFDDPKVSKEDEGKLHSYPVPPLYWLGGDTHPNEYPSRWFRAYLTEEERVTFDRIINEG